VTTALRRGYSLVEIMIVVAVLGIMAAAAVPSLEPNVAAQLDSTAEVVAADLAQFRQLAVAHNSKYLLTFQANENRYYLEHSGTNTALNTLPPTIYSNSANTATRQYFDLDDLPQLGPGVALHQVVVQASSPRNVTTVEFGPLGATTAAADTVVWLKCGDGDNLRYINVRINAVTGLAQVGDVDANGP
jgi:prepilin-type N-terminal cleavage/methylation domain-containing protein